MTARLSSLLTRARHILWGGGTAAGVLYFWLGANEAFEGPKTQATLLYGLALLAVSAPWLAQRLPQAWARQRGALLIGAALVAAVLASLVAGALVLPGNQALSTERSLPVLLAAFSALVFLLESPADRRRLLYFHLCAHVALLFYGAIQLLDQTWGASHGVNIDLIRWVRFGQTRVYSTLGNPDYMAAHLTLLAGLWLGLGWRGLDVKGAAQTAAAALLLVPLALIPAIFGQSSLPVAAQALGPWTLLCGLFYLAGRLVSARTLWLGLLGLLTLLVVVAQGRGAWLAAVTATAVLSLAALKLGGWAFFAERWRLLRWPLAAGVAGLALVLALLLARANRPTAAWIHQGTPATVLSTVDSLTSRLTHSLDPANDAQVVRRFYWRAAFELGLAHPLLGIGYGNHALFTARAQSAVWKRWDAAKDPRAALVEPHVELYTHDDYLQNFAETGLLGLTAFLVFWAFYLRMAWRLARSGGKRRLELGLGLLGLGIAFGINALTNFPWRVLATQQLCWLSFALLAAETSPPAEAALPGQGATPTVRPASLPDFKFGWLAVATLCLLLALFPIRWFFASLLFKQGNQRKDSPDPAQQVQGIPYYEAAVRAGLSGTQQVELYLYMGSLYNQAGRPDLAEQWFQRGIQRYPDFLEAWYNLGYTYQRRYDTSHDPKDLATALADYQHVLDIDPRSANALNNMGNLVYQQGDMAKASELYQRLLRYSPNSVEARYNLAAVHIRQGDRAGARPLLLQALALKPDFLAAQQLLAQLAHTR